MRSVAGRMGDVVSYSGKAQNQHIIDIPSNELGISICGRTTREESPRPVLATAQTSTLEKCQNRKNSSLISLPAIEDILREEKLSMQKKQSELVRKHLHDALTIRSRCYKALPNLAEHTDPFVHLRPIPENNNPYSKTKQQMKKSATVVFYPMKNKQSVPPYKHYIPIRQNILVSDTRYLAFEPYLGDIDADEEIQARNKWVEDYRKEFEIIDDSDGERKIWLYEYLSRILKLLDLSANEILILTSLNDVEPKDHLAILKTTKSIRKFMTAFRNIVGEEMQAIMPEVLEHITISKIPSHSSVLSTKTQPAEKLLEVYLSECPVCHMFACGVHGDYESNEDDDDDGESKSSDNDKDDDDEESESNGNQNQSNSYNSNGGDISDHHPENDANDIFNHGRKCNFGGANKEKPEDIKSFQPSFVDLNMTFEGMLNRWNDSIARGVAKRVEKKLGERTKAPCSSHCFLNIECDQVRYLEWRLHDLQFLQTLLLGIEQDARASCVVAPIFRKHCYIVHEVINLFVPQRKDPQSAIHRPSTFHSRLTKSQYWYDSTSKTIRKNVDLDRVTKVHYPAKCLQPMGCDHIGFRCQEAGDRCACFMDKIPCDKFCACSDDCHFKFKGCNCVKTGRPCSTNQGKCVCQSLGRECDPDLCQSCGAAEVANPFTRHEEPPANRCYNVAIQRGVEKRLLVGESSHPDDIGFGAYLAEPVAADEFISEYVGEIISSKEADLRWQLYEKLGLSYLFDLNKEMRIDSYRYGNKTRFINHSRKRANCYPLVKLVNGEHRIAFYAKKNLTAGVELFFDYGRQFVKTHGLKDESGDEADDTVDGAASSSPLRDVPPAIVIPEYDTDEYEEDRPAKRAKFDNARRSRRQAKLPP